MNKINKVFINAPIFKIEKNNEEVFRTLCSHIWKYNLEAVAPVLDMPLDNVEGNKDALCSLVSRMIHCDLIVTHGDWFNFSECVKLNEIARLLDIEVVHYSRLEDRLSTNAKITQ